MQKSRFLIILIFFSLISSSYVSAQDALVKSKDFFLTQFEEYQFWLESNKLGTILSAKNIEIKEDKLVLILTIKNPSNNQTCQEEGKSWGYLESQFNRIHGSKILLHEKLFKVWEILSEVSSDSLELEILCSSAKRPLLKISSTENGRITDMRFFEENLGDGAFTLKIDHLENLSTGGTIKFNNQESTIKVVRDKIKYFLLDIHYRDKGTPRLFTVRADTSETYYNQLIYKFSHLSHEVLDAGFFEYHIIDIEVENINGKIKVSWSFNGKFGSGIFAPPKRNDYKLIESYYLEDLKIYERKLFRLMEEYLSKS